MSVVTSKQTQSLVWSQRAVCTVPFLMAELYRCPSAADCVREGLIVRAGSALPSVCMGCTFIVCCAQTYGKLTCSGMSKSVRSPHAWLQAAPPPSSPLSPVSELVSLPRPCLPRMGVFGGGVFTDTRAG